MLIAPLRFSGETIGTFHVRTDRVGELGAMEAEKLRHIAPLFSMALKRGLRKAERNGMVERDVAEERGDARRERGEHDQRERAIGQALAGGEVAAADQDQQLQRGPEQEQHDREMHQHGVDVDEINHR